MRYDTFSGVVILIYMSLLWQISPSYNTDDKTQNMHDMRKVFRLSEKASQYEQRVIDILTWVTEEKRAKILVDMRNRLFDALSSSIPDSGHYAGIGFLDGLNQGHQKEYHFYNFLATNPALRQHFLIHLDQAIGALLKMDWWGINNINIAWTMQSLTGDSFDSTLGEIQQRSWQVWLVYFLEECIRTGKCLEQVWAYLANNCKENKFPSWDIKVLDISNLRSQLAFKIKLDSQDEDMTSWKSFSLSGWVSNALAEIGYIREFYRNGGIIRSMTGSSMGAIVAVMISKVVWELKGEAAVGAIDQLIQILNNELEKQIAKVNKERRNQKSTWKQRALHTFTIGKIPISIPGTSLKKSNAKELEETFLAVAKTLGIDEKADFNSLHIPVMINASHQYGNKWEKEVIIAGDMSIVDALSVTTNMPGRWSNNTGMFWEKKLSWLSLVDYAANEQGNMVSHLTDAWIKAQDIIALDVGYSSNEYNHSVAQACRLLFKRARYRDFSMKAYLRMNWGKAVDFDTDNTGNSGGEAFSGEILQKLVRNGAAAYNKNPVAANDSTFQAAA